MIPIAVPSKEEDLILHVARRHLVQTDYLVIETLPLGQVSRVSVVSVGLVSAIDQAEVLLILLQSVKVVIHFKLICPYVNERGCIGWRLVLQKVARNGGVVDIRGLSEGGKAQDGSLQSAQLHDSCNWGSVWVMGSEDSCVSIQIWGTNGYIYIYVEGNKVARYHTVYIKRKRLRDLSDKHVGAQRL